MDIQHLFEWVNRQTGVWVWPAGIFGLAVLFVLSLWMGAALANVEKLTFLRALWLGPLVMVAVLPAGYGIMLAIVGSDLSQWLTLNNILIGVSIVLAIDLVLVFVLVMLFGEASPGQSLVVWLFRLPVLALLSALVSGGIFVTIAIVQALQEPRGQTWITTIGWIFGGVVVLGIALYFATRITQAPEKQSAEEQPVILEGIVTTVAADGEVNVAPMGPHLPGLIADSSFPRRDPLENFVLKPFRGSRTYANLSTHGEGVLHVTDDVLLLAQAAIAVPDPFPELMPASQVRGFVLRDACRYAEFHVVSRDETSERAVFGVEVLHIGRLRDFFGFNRAMFAVVEAAILATRTGFLPLGDIAADYRRLAILVEKTGGVREHQAFALLQSHLDACLRAKETAS